MKTHDQDLDRQPAVYAKRSHRHPGIGFLSTLAFLLSLLSLLISGFLAYRFLDLQQAFGVINQALNRPPGSVREQSQTPNAQASPQPSPASGVVEYRLDPPELFIEPAFNNQAEVELIGVQRIPNPATEQRDIVNLQFRLRRVKTGEQANNPVSKQLLSPAEITARNSSTGATYRVVDAQQRATEPLTLNRIEPGSSRDAYVWLQVPEGVNRLDITIPQTQPFTNVPVSE
jgi:hypothetical protein